MPPRVCFSTLASLDWSWEEILERGPAYGYDGVEIRLIERETDLLSRPEFARDQLARRRAELEAARFQVCGLASSVRFDSPDPAERDSQIRTGLEYIRLARELGAKFVRVFGDVLPPDSPVAREQTLDAIARGLRILGDRGRDEGIDVVLETHGDFADSRLVAALLPRIQSDAVGVLWDTHHPWRFHGEPLAETFHRLQGRVRHTHWKDSVAVATREPTDEEAAAEALARSLMSGHRPANFSLMGHGEFPALECMRVLVASGYSGWFCYEWEKAWHPELAEPEIALPPFPAWIRRLWRQAARSC
jgi:sugar phosphate isomerase/epimerase